MPVFMAEFQRRKKLRTEHPTEKISGEGLPHAAAQELLALNRFLSDMQLAFGVRQRAPATLDAAVAATLELETYLHRPSLPHSTWRRCRSSRIQTKYD